MLSGCSTLSKVDYGNIYKRSGWQLPDKVIESLNVSRGDHVADIGAGEGYFTFMLADAVGPNGMVYAVEVEEAKVSELREKVEENGYSNIVVVSGEYEDPLLPDHEIDLALLCNTYHHIENRTAYFYRLRSDLKENGRVAVIDMKDELIVRLVVPAGHWTPVSAMHEEMVAAHYRLAYSFDYLPTQSFEIFTPVNDRTVRDLVKRVEL
ncbi:class I SAM-dependent methyltransferase [Acidobacteria bacterium AH-259-D05]|nr:class I SAM-dependent methyltransferase [Acidobacteria bacterium AH-259-D05]